MKKVVSILMVAMMLLSMSSCSIPIIRDIVGSENSLGKTNNTAVEIATAMEGFLSAKNKEDLVLYGVEMVLDSDNNGFVALYYAAAQPKAADYSDIYVAEVDSKTGHVERFSKANYSKDGIVPYQAVKEGDPLQAETLPVDSEKAIANGSKVFAATADFHYDYIELFLTSAGGEEKYDIRYISMLNDLAYYVSVDAVSGAVLASSVGEL